MGGKYKLADRKKVQKIRTKRTVKFKPPKDAAKKPKKVAKKTEHIQMKAEKPKKHETPVYTKQQKNKPVNRGSAEYKKTVKPVRTTTSRRNVKKNRSFSVIIGKKGELQKKRLVTLCVSFIVVASILIFCFSSPTGPIERITNAFALMGSGEFSDNFTGTKVLSLQTINNKAFALTNSHLCGYTSSGKSFLSLQHNFSKPVLEVAEERALVYNRESNKFIIANNSDLLFEQSVEQPIFCADISRNGSVAFVCDSASFSAQIVVFDKNMEQYYTWYLADGLISDIAISDNGKYVALAVLKVANGIFTTELYCLDTSEQEPLVVKKLSDETVYKIESVSSSNFVYTSDKRVAFLDWETGQAVSDNNLGAPAYFCNASDYYLTLYGETNHSDIVLYNDSGEIKHQFEYNGIIDDISVYNDNVFILSGNQVFYFDFLNQNKDSLTLESKPDYILGVEEGILTVNNTGLILIPVDSTN